MTLRWTTAAMLAATATLAACSGGTEPTEPVANEEVVPELIQLTIGKTPTEMLEQIGGNYYPTFEIAKGLGGERGEAWDEARFKSELAAALAPHSAQIDTAFAAKVAKGMTDGEAKRLLDLLEADKNAEYAACAFNTDGGTTVNRMDGCATSIGIEPSEALQDSLGTFASRMGEALQSEELMNIALGYATCKVLAKFGDDVSSEAVSLDLGSTNIGIGANKRPCTEYDELAAARFTSEVTPNFPKAQAESAE